VAHVREIFENYGKLVDCELVIDRQVSALSAVWVSLAFDTSHLNSSNHIWVRWW
jgi:hypothetical protein